MICELSQVTKTKTRIMEQRVKSLSCHEWWVDLFGREGLGKLEVLLVAKSEPVGDELQVSSHRRHTREAKVSRVHQ